MNQNTTVDSDLQKAIDDITKSTSNDPLFSDPVAAPAPVGPFPSASMTPAMPPRASMPVAPRPAMPPRMSMPKPAPAPMPKSEKMPLPEEIAPAEPVSAPIEDFRPSPIIHEDRPIEEPIARTPFMEEEGTLSIDQIKEAAMRKVAPIVGTLDIPAKEKFDIYKDVIDNYHDTSVIESAYRAASDIQDNKARAEALLYIIDTIDHM